MAIYLTADFGIDPYNKTLNPLYNPKNPCPLIVFLTQSAIPLYCLAPPAALFSSNCNCVLTYSVGYVIQISIPPVIPPVNYKFQYKNKILAYL